MAGKRYGGRPQAPRSYTDKAPHYVPPPQPPQQIGKPPGPLPKPQQRST